MVAAQIPAEWQTPSEKTDYRTTPRYEETRAFLEKLDAASDSIRLTSFGKTGQGRDLMLVVAAKDNDFTPEKARRHKKAVILIQACIHAGESDGKDAGLALLRDIAITKTRENLLDNVVILFEPIYNADGHERFSPFNRINQNGPEEMGWRGNARNVNLNRDYVKADEPETRAWLNLWKQWQPDLFVDCHVTDGADYQYNLTYQFEHHETVAPAIKTWLENNFERTVVPKIETVNGNLLAPYLEFLDNRDLTKGIAEFLSTPRFATGYTSLRNRPAILIETHMLKPYKSRVLATYDFLRFTLEEINRDSKSLFAANRLAEEETLTAFKIYDKDEKFPLAVSITEKSTPFQLKAVASTIELSDVSGANWVRFDSQTPLNLIVPYFNQTRVSAAVAPPVAYIVPPEWTEIIDRLELHGLKLERLPKSQTIEIESYRFSQPKWATAPFESRVMLSEFKTETTIEKREFPAGSVIVRLNQSAAKAAIFMLEPASPDSLLKWGFFNTIFEQKEYGEGYVLEKLAREILAKDPKLKQEFEERLKADEIFAKNPRARLDFFFRRSPYFDKNIGLYPVGRILQNSF